MELWTDANTVCLWHQTSLGAYGRHVGIYQPTPGRWVVIRTGGGHEPERAAFNSLDDATDHAARLMDDGHRWRPLT